MTLVPLGPGREFDAIRLMLARWGASASGIGGDAASLVVPAGQRLLVSTDTSVEGVHFRRDWMTPVEIGYRATVAALSDLAAVAATPLGILLSLTLPSAWESALPELAEGVGAAARLAEAPIVGGDTVSGSELSLTLTVLGSAERPVSRVGAKPGGRVYVTGLLGGPDSALRGQLAGADRDPVSWERFVHPVPRLAEARWLAARGVAAAIDISDGLVADVAHVAAASGVTIVLDLFKLRRVPWASMMDAAASGEEYELVVISDPGAALDEVAFADAFGLPLTEIGHVEVARDRGVEVWLGPERVDPPRGYDHFSR